MALQESLLNHASVERGLWQHRVQGLSTFVAKGYLHLACATLSCLVLFLQSCLRSKCLRIKQKDSAKGMGVRPCRLTGILASTTLQLLLATGALICDVVPVSNYKSWKHSSALVYLIFLGFLRLVLPTSLHTTAYHHLNAVSVTVTILETVRYLLPLGVVGTPHEVSRVNVLQLACEACIWAISFISSRNMLPRNVDDLSLRPGSDAAPEETCSWYSYYISYGWLTQLILKGFAKDLSINDLPSLPSYDSPSLWLRRLRSARAAKMKTLRALCWIFRQDILTIILWAILTGCIEYLGPFSMYNLLSYLEASRSGKASGVVHPFVWVALLFAGPMLRSICYQRSIFLSTRLLVRTKALIIQEVYQKILTSRASERLNIPRDGYQDDSFNHNQKEDYEKEPPIKTESLMSYDADAISNTTDVFYAFTASMVSTAVAMTFLYQLLGFPSLVGVLVLIILTPLPALFSRRISRMHGVVMKTTDARLSLIAENLRSIRTLKYFGWVPLAQSNIKKIRTEEQQRIWRRNMSSMFVAMTGDMLSLGSLLAMFSSLILFTDVPLRAPTAFTALAITETLRSQYVWLSKVAQWVAQGYESIRRVDTFMESAVEKVAHKSGPPAFSNATFSVSSECNFKLQELSVAFREGHLNVVTGPTGSGKTSMLLSLLGESILESGEATCPSDVAFVPQTSWLENSTIRQNILFYSPFNESRYNEVLHACDLVTDLLQMPNGDLTPVGERGCSLSGGQKQRVSLARALYSAASTLLLDDVFSALDAHTSAAVYRRCFQGSLMKNRTVILVTHLATAIADASFLVSLDHGRISALRQGSVSVSEENFTMPSTMESLAVSSYLKPQSQVLDMQIIDNATPSETSLALVEPTAFEHNESRASGRVPRKMSKESPILLFHISSNIDAQVLKYMFLFGGYSAASLAIFSALLVQVAYFSITLWLSIWTSFATQDDEGSHVVTYLLIYMGTVIAFVSLQLLNNFTYQRGGWHAAKTMHERLVNSVLQAPLSWFDHTPIGNIINRFGLDIQSLDAVLVDWLRMTLDNGLRFLLRLASIASIMPIFALPASCICLLGFITGELYSRAEISIKRLCSVKFSPVFSHFSDTVAGMPVIRGRHLMVNVFQDLLADKITAYMRACEAQFNCNRWVSIRSDFCAATIAVSAGCIAYYKSGSASLVGFSLTNAIGLSQTILTLVRNMNELEVELNSFQRVSEYTSLEPEEAPVGPGKALPSIPAAWPSSGKIEFKNACVRYANEGPDVLHNINLTVRSGERFALIGRTGSGKSTLGLSLLRSTQISSGEIVLDGMAIRDIPLQRLRTSISLIPQETMLFSGDVRSNLDPAGELGDSELQSILDLCNETLTYTDMSGTSRSKLKLYAHTPVINGGENFSNGQKQIIGLARAICRRSKVIIMDEATASVDNNTEMNMQKLIRTEFCGSSIITIAHRLRTIMNYDRVAVMAAGKIQEMGSPLDLIQVKGAFWEMLRQSGEYDELVALAQK